MEAEIITIGTEILLGQIVDTNTRAIAHRLRDLGLDIYRTSTVGDNITRIADAVAESMGRAAAVITTGGLGPTVDDPTREGIALALGVKTRFEPALWAQIEARFASMGRTPSENNKRQAYIPIGAVPIENPVGTAPAFYYETSKSVVVALPGVPVEMNHLLENEVLPYLKERLHLSGTILTRVIRTAGIGESALDDQISDLEELSNPTVGLSAHPGRVDIRITAKAASKHEAEEMIRGIETTLQQRLSSHIYGFDSDTLESAIGTLLADQGLMLAVVEYGTDGALATGLVNLPSSFAGGQMLSEPGVPSDMRDQLRSLMSETGAGAGLGLSIAQTASGWQLGLLRILPSGEAQREDTYGGGFLNENERGVSFSLEFLRRGLLRLS